jgi:ABC-type transport system involved in cytochrome bd biosynthesis fused ATPase/permease subunit
MEGMKTRRSSGKLGKLMLYAPLVLQAVSALRRSQVAKRGKYVKASKRDRALDFVLGQAERRLGGKKGSRRRPF